MLNFLKPKITVSALADSHVSMILKILAPENEPTISELLTQLTAMGADIRNLQIEVAVFTIFTQWLGLATALQKGDINEARLEELEREMWRRLDAAVADTRANALCLRERGESFIDFAWDRYEQLITISTEAPRSSVQEDIIDEFSNWLCSAEPPTLLKQAILLQYVYSAQAVSNNLARTRVVSS